MAVIMVFLLGVANFAWHRAVLESGHSVVRAITRGGIGAAMVTLGLEFVLLLAALAATWVNGAWAWAYGFYSLCNGGAAWAILTRRI